MQDAKSIIDLQKQSDEGVSQLELLLQQTNDFNEKIMGDGSRSVQWREDEVKRHLEKISPALSTHVNLIREIGKEAVSNQPFWESKTLLLSLKTFSEDPEKDAMIRLSRRAELEMLPLPILDLKLKAAIKENDLPMVFQCWLVGSSTHEKNYQPGKTPHESVDFSLSGVTLPDQEIVLDAIKKCWSNVHRAEYIFSGIHGRKHSPQQRLTMARQHEVITTEISAASAL